MTTIATDGRMLAGDGRSTNDDDITGSTRRKVFPLPDGSIVGMAGRTMHAERAVRALQADPKHPEQVRGDFTLLRLRKNGRVEVYEGDLTAALVVKPPFAIGTGRTAALGAMKAGATARQAVEIAAQIDVYTGGKITSYSR